MNYELDEELNDKEACRELHYWLNKNKEEFKSIKFFKRNKGKKTQ